MTTQRKSILVVAPDATVSDAIGAALAAHGDLKIDTHASTLSQMNGTAVKIASDYDLILFQTRPDDLAEIRAIEALTAVRRGGTVLVALADSGITLTQARALNRAGVSEVLPIPVIGSEIGEQIARLGRDAATLTQGTAKSGRIIAVAQARGGVGSTTVAVNLADQLVGKRGFLGRGTVHSVALVDLDLQFGTVGSYLDLEDQDALLRLAMEGTLPDATFLHQAMVTMPNGMTVLAAPAKFAPLDALRSDQVAAILDTLRQSHDYVVIDLPRAMVGWIEPIMQRADELIIVTDIAVSSVRHCRRLIDFFTADNVTLPVQVVVNHERRPLLQRRLQREAEKALQRKFDHWLPHDPGAARAAADRGKPLSLAAPRSALTKALRHLAATTLKAFPVAHLAQGK